MSKFPVGRNLKTMSLCDVARGICFLKTLHSKALTITAFTWIKLDWFSLLPLVHIQHVNTTTTSTVFYSISVACVLCGREVCSLHHSWPFVCI